MQTNEEVKTEIKSEKTEVKATPAAKAKPKRKRKVKAQVAVSARRKLSVGRATIRAGKGIVRVNKLLVDAIANPYVRDLVLEPLKMAPEYVSKVNIDVSVRGGGAISQAQAIRTAITKALVEYTQDQQLRSMFLNHDRYMLIEDSRMVEPKKYGGRKARARRQKSYR